MRWVTPFSDTFEIEPCTHLEPVLHHVMCLLKHHCLRKPGFLLFLSPALFFLAHPSLFLLRSPFLFALFPEPPFLALFSLPPLFLPFFLLHLQKSPVSYSSPPSHLHLVPFLVAALQLLLLGTRPRPARPASSHLAFPTIFLRRDLPISRWGSVHSTETSSTSVSLFFLHCAVLPCAAVFLLVWAAPPVPDPFLLIDLRVSHQDTFIILFFPLTAFLLSFFTLLILTSFLVPLLPDPPLFPCSPSPPLPFPLPFPLVSPLVL